MDDLLLVIGTVFCASGAIPLAVVYLDPLVARERHRLVRMFKYRARRAGLRGRYDVSKPDASGRYGTYEPADDEDRALFAAVGPSIESESEFFATQTLWNDERLAWGGATLLVIGVVLLASSAFV
jgi:hypothetical protein